MPIISADLTYYRSTNDLGGAITEDLVPDNVINALFDQVGSEGSLEGEINYRCIYMFNSNASITLQSAKTYIEALTPSAGTTLAIGVGTSIAGSVEQSIANEDTPPVGVFFTSQVGSSNTLDMGAIPAQSWKAIWLRRTVVAGTGASSSDGTSIVVQGDTTA
jgi:hypothetical protein